MTPLILIAPPAIFFIALLGLTAQERNDTAEQTSQIETCRDVVTAKYLVGDIDGELAFDRALDDCDSPR